MSLLNWFETRIPDEREIGALTYINHDGCRLGGHHLLCLAMPPKKALLESQFMRLGYKKPVTRGEATSAVCGIGGHEGLTLDIALNKVLHVYWSDPTIPAHLPKQLPTDPAEAQALMQYWHERMFGKP